MGAKRPKSLVCYIPIVRFDVYWIQTDRQTNKQTDKPNLYIDIETSVMQF